jgi:hypothetical protein
MRRHGAQGILDTASKGQLEGEFGTTKEEEIVKVILERGSVQETTVGCHSLVLAFFFFFPWVVALCCWGCKLLTGRALCCACL